MSTRIDDSHSGITYSGGWETLRDSDYHQSALHSTTTVGATASISFNGIGIVAYGTIMPYPGGGEIIAEFVLDGRAHRWVQGSSANPWHKVRMWDSSNLQEGPHTLVVRNLKGQVPFQLDFFELWGTVTSSPVPPPKPEEPTTSDTPAPPVTTPGTTRGNNGGGGGGNPTTPLPTTQIVTKIITSVQQGGGLTTVVQVETPTPNTSTPHSGTSSTTQRQIVTDRPSGSDSTAFSETLMVVTGSNGGVSTITAFQRLPTPDASSGEGGDGSSGDGTSAGSSGRLPTGVIAGLVVGGIILVTLAAIIAWLLRRRRRAPVADQGQELPTMKPFDAIAPRTVFEKPPIYSVSDSRPTQVDVTQGSQTSFHESTEPSDLTRRPTQSSSGPFADPPNPFVGGYLFDPSKTHLPLMIHVETQVTSDSAHASASGSGSSPSDTNSAYLSYLSPVAEAPPPAYTTHRTSTVYAPADSHITSRQKQ